MDFDPAHAAAQYYWPLTADGQPKFRAVEAKDRSGQPILDAYGKPTFNQVPVGDVDKFMEIAGALRSRRSGLPASSLLRCRPLRCRSSSPPPPRSRSTTRCISTMRGASITTIDGEVVEEPDMKLIESDRSDGPDA